MQQDIRTIIVNERIQERRRAADRARLARTLRDASPRRTSAPRLLVRLPAIALRRLGALVAA